AHFCYRVTSTTTQTANQGFIKLEVTGIASNPSNSKTVSRVLSTTLRPDGFIDFIYYTDVEVLHPLLLSDPAGCVQHYYETRPSGCTEIQWGPNDVIDGPMHSNDALNVGGSVWFKNS